MDSPRQEIHDNQGYEGECSSLLPHSLPSPTHSPTLTFPFTLPLTMHASSHSSVSLLLLLLHAFWNRGLAPAIAGLLDPERVPLHSSHPELVSDGIHVL